MRDLIRDIRVLLAEMLLFGAGALMPRGTPEAAMLARLRSEYADAILFPTDKTIGETLGRD